MSPLCCADVVETEPPVSETPAPLVATPSDECEGDPVAVYEQCGGDTWTGSTCCEDGLDCIVMGTTTCYSQVGTQAIAFGVALVGSDALCLV